MQNRPYTPHPQWRNRLPFQTPYTNKHSEFKLDPTLNKHTQKSPGPER
jgi:hypothetical protein